MKKNLRAVRGKLAESLDVDERHWLHALVREMNEQPTLLPHDSVDAAIDDQIMQAEKAAKGQVEARRRGTLRALLEAGDDDNADDKKQPQPDKNAEANPIKPNLDVANFAREAARIYEHASDLVDLQGTVLRRILNYVSKTYGADASKQLQQSLEADYEVSLTRPEDRDHSEVGGINAAGAGPEVGGG